MADTLGVFQKTEPEQPQDNSDLDKGRIISSGVGLNEGESAAILALSKKLKVSRNSLMRFAIHWFIMQVRAGKVDLSSFIETPPEPRRTLRMP